MINNVKILFKRVDINNLSKTTYVDKIISEVSKVEAEFIMISFKGHSKILSMEFINVVENELKRIAKESEKYIITGIMNIATSNGQIQQCKVINDCGVTLFEPYKEYDSNNISHIDKFEIVETTYGKIAITLGKDIWSLEIPRILALKGARLIFAPDLPSNVGDCEEEHILGVSVINCVGIVYQKQEEEQDRLIVVMPKSELVNEFITTEKIVEIDLGEIDQLREPDVSFKNTLWWVLWGRKPEHYSDILLSNDFLHDKTNAN